MRFQYEAGARSSCVLWNVSDTLDDIEDSHKALAHVCVVDGTRDVVLLDNLPDCQERCADSRIGPLNPDASSGKVWLNPSLHDRSPGQARVRDHQPGPFRIIGLHGDGALERPSRADSKSRVGHVARHVRCGVVAELGGRGKVDRHAIVVDHDLRRDRVERRRAQNGERRRPAARVVLHRRVQP